MGGIAAMPGERDISNSPTDTRGGWFGFISLARMEFRGPIAAAVAAAAAMTLLLTLREADNLPPWMLASPALAFLGTTLWGWIASNRQLQALDDYPLSKIGSAPQGYVRLEGQAAAFPGSPLESPLTHRSCCWYSYQLVERDDERGKSVREEHDTSEWSFVMNDGSGTCVVDPAGAELVSVRVKKWREGKFDYIERLILPGDPLFVLGQFATAGAMVNESDIEFRVGELISEWKKEMPTLIQRFDLRSDGRIGEQEWERVRKQARREIEANFARNPPQSQNSISRPGDGRPYIISAESRARLEREIKIWAWIHLSCFLLGVACLAAWAFHH
jgi:hypothetical protein